VSYTPNTSSVDWVILGVTASNGSVLVMASTDLTEAELASERLDNLHESNYRLGYYTPHGRPAVWEHKLTVTMKSYVQITAPTYAEAMAKLFGEWTPAASPRPAIDSGPKRVGA
jgi:hypothetical protein